MRYHTSRSASQSLRNYQPLISLRAPSWFVCFISHNVYAVISAINVTDSAAAQKTRALSGEPDLTLIFRQRKVLLFVILRFYTLFCLLCGGHRSANRFPKLQTCILKGCGCLYCCSTFNNNNKTNSMSGFT